MAEKDVLAHIDELIAEEHRLRTESEGAPVPTATLERLHAIEVQLDQAWDLLRQRRARSEFGRDPAAAQERPVSEVEGYRQ
jgi:hypothetical protein